MIETAPLASDGAAEALDRPLHILHVHAAEEARGGEYQTLALLENLAKLGHRQTLLAPPGCVLAVQHSVVSQKFVA